MLMDCLGQNQNDNFKEIMTKRRERTDTSMVEEINRWLLKRHSAPTDTSYNLELSKGSRRGGVSLN